MVVVGVRVYGTLYGRRPSILRLSTETENFSDTWD